MTETALIQNKYTRRYYIAEKSFCKNDIVIPAWNDEPERTYYQSYPNGWYAKTDLYVILLSEESVDVIMKDTTTIE